MRMGNSLFRIKRVHKGDHQLAEAMEEAKRKSVYYRIMPPMEVKDPPYEKSAERAEAAFEKEPAAEQHQEEERLDYPEAAHLEGRPKVDALAGLILQDKGIDTAMKKKRLNYLIALNARNHWTSDQEVRNVVETAAKSLG